MSEIKEAKSLRWLAMQFPLVEKPKDDIEKMQSCINLYCTAAAEKIEQLTEENEKLRAEEKQSQILIKTLHDKLDEGYEKFVDEERADTVRKMKERTAEIIGDLIELVFDDNMPNCIVPHCHKPDSIGCGHRICIDENKAIWLEKLDQIAKELEGG